MILVLDTSAGAEIVLARGRAAEMGAWVAEAEWVIAPTLYISEMTNVFWKYHQFSNVPIEQCETGLDRAIQLIDDFVHEREMYREAFALACRVKKPVYDMFFLVLARRTSGAILTLDEGLQRLARENAIRILTTQT